MSIATKQNEPLQRRRLAAQRNLYARAKSALAWQMVLGGPVGIFLVFAVLLFPEMRAVNVAYAILVGALIEYLVIRQKKLREMAAKIQEAFDCDVLELPWKELKVGGRVGPEVEVEQCALYQTWAHKMPTTENWYSVETARIPLSIGRICCQRSNCWWDGSQRRQFANWMMIAMLAMLILTIAIGWIFKLSMGDVVMTIVLPLYPTARVCYLQYRDHSDAALRLEALTSHAARLFDEACKNPNAPDLLDKSRDLQNEIFESRKKNPPVFDWVFKRDRNKNEVLMNFSSADLANLALQRIGGTKT